ncbi:MAG: WG repeat-containing protein [Clostridia bacterium]|nr:WG repeat-containing protein [Clostridia bacterium]
MNKKRIGIIICCIAVIVVLCVVLVGIFNGKPTNSDDNTELDSTEIYQYLIVDSPDITLPESKQFSWYKKPFFSATDIKAVRDIWHQNTIYKYIDTEYVAYYVGDYCGIANSYGEIFTNAIYTQPYYCPEYVGIAFSYNHNRIFDFASQSVVYHGGHGGGYSDLYYDLNSKEYICISGSEGENDAVDFDKTGIYIVREAYMNILGEYLYYDGSMCPYYEFQEKGRIGLYNNGKLVIPFEYVAATEVSDGVVGMFDGNMWTYFTVDGKVIMENVPPNDDTAGYHIFENDEYTYITVDSVYNYSCGCVPVKKDGKWGYMDKNGEMIIDAVFDSALPAFENRAWVCVDGYWGIIEI